MKEFLTIQEQSDQRWIEYEIDPRTQILYQREILQKEMDSWCLPHTVQNGRCIYEVDLQKSLDRYGARQPSVQEILKLLEAFDRQALISEDALLDRTRWCWDAACWSWDADRQSLRGIYIPDRSFSSDRGVFLNGLSSQLMRFCLAEHWENEETILFLHRLYRAGPELASETLGLKEFIERERENIAARSRMEEVAVIPETTLEPQKKKPRLLKLFFHRRQVALPFG